MSNIMDKYDHMEPDPDPNPGEHKSPIARRIRSKIKKHSPKTLYR